MEGKQNGTAKPDRRGAGTLFEEISGMLRQNSRAKVLGRHWRVRRATPASWC